MLLSLELGRELSAVLRQNREPVGHLGSSYPCRTLPSVNKANSPHNRSYVVLERRHSQPRWEADLCRGFKATWRVAPLRLELASVSATAVGDLGDRRDLLG